MNKHLKTGEHSIPSLCIYHNNQTRNIICNCGMKLCIICVSEHLHPNIFFQNESEYVNAFKTEAEGLLELINKYEEKIQIENSNSNIGAIIKQIEIPSLKGLKDKITKIYNEIKLESINSYYKQNYREKILNSIIQHYKKKTNSKLNMINKIANDNIANNNKNSEENSIMEFSIKNKDLNDEFIFRKNSNLSPFLSNNENLSPSVTSKRILNNKHIIITNFTTKFNEEMMSKHMTEGDLSSFNIQPNFLQNQVNKMKMNEGLMIYPVKKENNILNFNIGNNNEFLGSGESKSPNCVKMVCITCRERFTVLKDQILWKRRCELCSENHNFN